MEGWVKLHRQILDNPIVCKDSEYFSIWCYLILNATHTEYDSIFKGERIKLKPGQLITGRKSISTKFNISESKVQRVLKKLEIEQQIEQQTSSTNRLISIVNWGSYQNSEQLIEQPVNNERTTTEQQLNTNKNVKKVKNEKNEVDIYTQEKEIFDYWNNKKGVTKSLEKSFNKSKISTAIKNIGKDKILIAIDRLDKSVLDPNYYYNFKWNIYKFIKQSNGISNWMDDGQLWNDYISKTKIDGKHTSNTWTNKSETESRTDWNKYEQSTIIEMGEEIINDGFYTKQKF